MRDYSDAACEGSLDGVLPRPEGEGGGGEGREVGVEDEGGVVGGAG